MKEGLRRLAVALAGLSSIVAVGAVVLSFFFESSSMDKYLFAAFGIAIGGFGWLVAWVLLGFAKK